MKTYLVYVIKDITGTIKYVGSTTRTLEARLQGHFSDARNGTSGTQFHIWLKQALKQEAFPTIQAIGKYANTRDMLAAETKAILDFLAEGCNVLNTTRTISAPVFEGHKDKKPVTLWLEPALVEQLELLSARRLKQGKKRMSRQVLITEAIGLLIENEAAQSEAEANAAALKEACEAYAEVVKSAAIRAV